MTEPRPLLSICIPTFARADLLELLLRSLCPQVAELEGRVEIVVSDNCSPDRTPEVVEAASQLWPIRYSRNERNLGGQNTDIVVEHATGEYSWVIGDDDMVIRDRLPGVVEAIAANRDLDYFFVNWVPLSVDERDRLILTQDARFEPPVDRWICRDPEWRRVASWEELFDVDTRERHYMFTGLFSNIVRTSLWRQYAPFVRFSNRAQVSAADRSVDELFPHVKVLALAMIGKPAYYIGTPSVVMGRGAQSWSSDWPVVSLVGMGDALELYERLGMSPARLHRLWRSHWWSVAEYLPVIGDSRDMPCLEGFPWAAYVWGHRRWTHELLPIVRHRLHPGSRLKRSLPEPVFDGLRAAWRVGRGAGRSGPAAQG